ncbi:MAG: CRTAC1 family protein [Pseudomonadota bacterium]
MRRRIAAGLIALLGSTVQGAAADDAGAWFTDVSAPTGVDFAHVRALTKRLWLPEIMSGGAAWLDVDGDGRLDLYLVQGGYLAQRARTPEDDANDASVPAQLPANVLLRNDGERFEDITASSGTGDTGYGMGAAAADYDGDGDTDLYVTNLGPNVLYRNEGDGRFTDVTAASGTGHDGWGTSAAWLDYDADGDLDLFVANYINWAPTQELNCFTGGATRDYCHPRHYNAPAADVLYRNEGDGTFTDVTEAAGLLSAFGHGLGVAVADLDGDGRTDIYVANDGMPNQLWQNLGDGTFEDIGLLSGTAVNMAGKAEAGMGVAAVDADGDGDLDLFMSHLRGETNTLYVNEGGDFFRDATPGAGLAAPSVAYTGFGLGFADFDLDGTVDLYVTNGRVGASLPPLVPGKPFAEPNLLFRGTGGGRFTLLDAELTADVPDIENSRAAAFADYDDDGDIDVLVVNNGGPTRLLRNDAPRGDGHWVGFALPQGLGGEVIVRSADGRLRRAVAQPAYSYQSSNDPRVHFGLGASAALIGAVVRWPTGQLERFEVTEADRYHVLARGQGVACEQVENCLPVPTGAGQP